MKIFIDFEYRANGLKEYELICCCLYSEKHEKAFSFWLFNSPKEKTKLVNFLNDNKDCIFVGHSIYLAECMAFISLGLQPEKFKWIDTQVEYSLLLNKSYFSEGKHLIKGEIYNLKTKPKYTNDDELPPYGKSWLTPSTSLVSMAYRLLSVRHDQDAEKEEMISLILNTKEYSEDDKKRIITYCFSDVIILKDCFPILEKCFHFLTSKNFNTLHAVERGHFCALTARMQANGYPYNAKQLNNLLSNFETLKKEFFEECQSVLGDRSPLTLEKNGYKKNIKAIQIEALTLNPKISRTEKGAVKVDDDTLRKFFPNEKNAQGPIGFFMRWNKIQKDFSGFKKSLDIEKRDFFYYADNGRSYCPLTPFKSRTSRSQPPSTPFIPLKSSWLRSLVQPEKGKNLFSIDYSQQEILIAGILSNDQKLIDAYVSGDVYLSFAKSINFIPGDGTKETHKKERDLCKSVVLGMQYGMSAKGIAKDLENSTGVLDEDLSQKLYNSFNSTYSHLYKFKQKTLEVHKLKGFLEIEDGWMIFGKEDNPRTLQNFPIQSTGASVLRDAVKNCFSKNLKVIFTLHDALYFECENAETLNHLKIAEACMRDACVNVLGLDGQKMRMDSKIWGEDYVNHRNYCPVLVEDKGARDYKDYSKYLHILLD